MNFNYKPTPRGIEEKGRMTVSFLKRKLREYEEIKHQIEMLTRDVQQKGLSFMARSELTKGPDVLRWPLFCVKQNEVNYQSPIANFTP